MKTLVKDNLSLYLLDDATFVGMEADKIVVGEPAQFIIGDCNSSNTALHENVTAPTDWIGGKYLFVNGKFTVNPDWVDPSVV